MKSIGSPMDNRNASGARFHFRKSIFLLLAAMLLSGLWGCASEKGRDFSFSDTEPISLWVVTEETASDGMNYQARLIAHRFQEEHPNVTIQLDILPWEEQERAARLEELSEKMDAGCGPDVFLLPTAVVAELDYPTRYTYRSIQPLFSDAAAAMREGFFADIEEYYAGDASLEKEALKSEVMDAGKVGQARYILPIRFNQPVIYVFGEALAPYGVSTDLSDLKTIDQWMDFAIAQGDPVLACGAEYTSHNAFSSFIDYDSKTVTLSADDVEAYMHRFQQLEALIGSDSIHRSGATLWPMMDEWYSYPIHLDSLSAALIYCEMAQERGETVSMYPLQSTGGDIIANVSYYGAVGSGSKNTDAAYAFLRLFLTEEFQWETGRPDTQYARLLENSWPVRTKNSAAPLWGSIQRSGSSHTDPEFSDDSVAAILDGHIDIVRFPFADNFPALLYSLNSADNPDIRKLSEEYIKSLYERIPS